MPRRHDRAGALRAGRGKDPEDDPHLIAWSIWSAVHGFVHPRHDPNMIRPSTMTMRPIPFCSGCSFEGSAPSDGLRGNGDHRGYQPIVESPLAAQRHIPSHSGERSIRLQAHGYLTEVPVPSNADNAFEAASFAQKAALRSTEETIRNDASSSEENTNRMIPSDNPSESSTSTPTARILSADATAATHSDGQCDSDPTMPDGQSGSPSEPLSMGPAWPIRRKASWAKDASP